MGTGHFARCLALADEVKSAGADVRFVSRYLPAPQREALLGGGYGFTQLAAAPAAQPDALPHSAWLGTSQVQDARQTLDALAGERCDWLIVDHYALGARWESAARAGASRILAVDDLADRVHDCDLLLDQSAPADQAERYREKVPDHCGLLLGTRYALLRQEFAVARRHSNPRDGEVRRVLVFLGGADAEGYTLPALDGLEALDLHGVAVDVVIGRLNPNAPQIEARCAARGFRLHVQTARMAELMRDADLAVGAGGISTWERCCLGLPALTLCVAENQRRLIDDAATRGLVYAPEVQPRDASAIGAHLRCLAGNPLLLRALSRNGMAAVDGRGAQRVLRAMGCTQVSLRAAASADAANIYEWRNHAETRAASGNPEPISRPDHDRWFGAMLADDARVLLIGEVNAEAVGAVRFDIAGGEAQVSIYLVPGLPGRGLGPQLLGAAERWLVERRPEIRSFKASVLRDNHRSHGLFQACDYRRSVTQYHKEVRRP